ncbi:hypothetical protein DFH29DRAFT_1007869 [Suillus ampliporus]|nr:hypothetical protein DFH29DRAFT_1007869 [Suillus ampliporus]
MATRYFKLVRSHKEIVWLNVKIKHLHCWVEHEDRTTLEAIDSLLADDPDSPFIAELKTLYAKHHRVNNNHRKRLQQIYALDRYTGERLPTDQTVTASNGDRDDEGSMNGPEDDAMNEEAMRLEDLAVESVFQERSLRYKTISSIRVLKETRTLLHIPSDRYHCCIFLSPRDRD